MNIREFFRGLFSGRGKRAGSPDPGKAEGGRDAAKKKRDEEKIKQRLRDLGYLS